MLLALGAVASAAVRKPPRGTAAPKTIAKSLKSAVNVVTTSMKQVIERERRSSLAPCAQRSLRAPGC
jgi:hypothetical protein